MFKSNCVVTLFRMTLQQDGTASYDSGTSYHSFYMEHCRTFPDGRREELSELLMPPESSPSPGDMVEINGDRHHIAGVRRCTGAGGEVRACRCNFMK